MGARREREIRSQLHNCSGWKINARLSKVARAYKIFSGNYEELNNVLATAEDPKRAIQLASESGHPELQTLMETTLRHLHNYIASAKMLIEHSRPVFREIFTNEMFEAYSDYVADNFANDPLARFLQQLRDYTLHWQTPDIAFTLRLAIGEAESGGFGISCDSLLKWDKWDTRSRRFIESSKPDLCLHSVTRSYSSKVGALMKWVAQLIEHGFDNEFREMDALQRELYEVVALEWGNVPEYIRRHYEASGDS